MKEQWIADFSKTEKSCFDIKSEFSYNAYLENGSLTIGLKKKNCMAWLETEDRLYEDQVIEAHFRLESNGGYSAAGIMFRIIEQGTYYLALVSSKGFFRLDAISGGTPRPLIGWTEAPGLNERGIHLAIIACRDHLIFTLNGRWIAETHDDSIMGGHLGFALVSYDLDQPAENRKSPNTETSKDESAPEQINYCCRAWLDFLSVNSRSRVVEAEYKKWNNSKEITAESRLRLAESFAALDRTGPALDQIIKAWERREEAARSVTATYTEMRTRRELLLAAKIASRLKEYEKAEEYINACLVQGVDNIEGEEALAEKAKILSELEKYDELKMFLPQYIAHSQSVLEPSALASLHGLLGHAHWNLHEYEAAAAAWDRAFELNGENMLYAGRAAEAYERLGKKEEALRRCLETGKTLFRQEKYDELGDLIPRLLSVGENCWEARALAGKWAFALEDFDRAESELEIANELRRKLRPLPAADPAVSYLRGLLLVRRDKPRQAFPLFAEAARLAPDYGMFRFKLAETRYRIGGNAHDPELADDLQAARSLLPNDDQVRSFAAEIELARSKAIPDTAESSPEPVQVEARESRAEPSDEIAGDKPVAAEDSKTAAIQAAAGESSDRPLAGDAEESLRAAAEPYVPAEASEAKAIIVDETAAKTPVAEEETESEPKVLDEPQSADMTSSEVEIPAAAGSVETGEIEAPVPVEDSVAQVATVKETTTTMAVQAPAVEEETESESKVPDEPRAVDMTSSVVEGPAAAGIVETSEIEAPVPVEDSAAKAVTAKETATTTEAQASAVEEEVESESKVKTAPDEPRVVDMTSSEAEIPAAAGSVEIGVAEAPVSVEDSATQAATAKETATTTAIQASALKKKTKSAAKAKNTPDKPRTSARKSSLAERPTAAAGSVETGVAEAPVSLEGSAAKAVTVKETTIKTAAKVSTLTGKTKSVVKAKNAPDKPRTAAKKSSLAESPTVAADVAKAPVPADDSAMKAVTVKATTIKTAAKSPALTKKTKSAAKAKNTPDKPRTAARKSNVAESPVAAKAGTVKVKTVKAAAAKKPVTSSLVKKPKAAIATKSAPGRTSAGAGKAGKTKIAAAGKKAAVTTTVKAAVSKKAVVDSPAKKAKSGAGDSAKKITSNKAGTTKKSTPKESALAKKTKTSAVSKK